MNEERLKPCPFCGGEARVTGYKSFWIVCKECLSESTVFDTKNEAIKAWNRRTCDLHLEEDKN